MKVTVFESIIHDEPKKRATKLFFSKSLSNIDRF